MNWTQRRRAQQLFGRALQAATRGFDAGVHSNIMYFWSESNGLCQAMFLFSAKSAARFRSAGRDRETDERRLAAIKSAVREALVAAEREKSALGQRLEQARTSATILAGTDTYEHETRPPERAARLAESEAEMSRAENRLLDLDRHISKLKRIEGAILDESDIPSRQTS